MAVSKIVVNGITQMDVTQDTVVADKLAEGYTAHRNDGVQITGTMSGGGGGGGGLTKYTSTNVTVANDQVTIALPTGITTSDCTSAECVYLTSAYCTAWSGQGDFMEATYSQVLVVFDQYGYTMMSGMTEDTVSIFAQWGSCDDNDGFYFPCEWYDASQDLYWYTEAVGSLVVIK